MQACESIPIEHLSSLNQMLITPRKKYPQEARYNWLVTLLDIYHLIDVWVKIDIEYKKINHKMACQRGCSNCCKTLTIPICGLEFSGLSWYVSEVLSGEEKYLIKNKLLNHQEVSNCPFLVKDICTVYPLRPIACRQFHVLNHPCQDSENIWLTRKGDIYSALHPEIFWMIGKKVLELYGIKGEMQQRSIFDSGFFEGQDKPIVNYNWVEVGKKII